MAQNQPLLLWSPPVLRPPIHTKKHAPYPGLWWFNRDSLILKLIPMVVGKRVGRVGRVVRTLIQNKQPDVLFSGSGDSSRQ